MSKEKIIHARIDDDVHNQLLEKCNELGCSLSDYFVSIVEGSLEDSESADEPELSEQLPKYDLNVTHGKVTDSNGNLIGYVKGFPKPEIKFV